MCVLSLALSVECCRRRPYMVLTWWGFVFTTGPSSIWGILSVTLTTPTLLCLLTMHVAKINGQGFTLWKMLDDVYEHFWLWKLSLSLLCGQKNDRERERHLSLSHNHTRFLPHTHTHTHTQTILRSHLMRSISNNNNHHRSKNSWRVHRKGGGLCYSCTCMYHACTYNPPHSCACRYAYAVLVHYVCWDWIWHVICEKCTCSTFYHVHACSALSSCAGRARLSPVVQR